MVRPLGREKLKVKRLRGNAIGLNLVAVRDILTDPPKAMVNTDSKADPFQRSEQRFRPFNYALQICCRKDSRKYPINSDSEDGSINEEKETTDELTNSLMEIKPKDLSLITDPVVHPKKTKHETFILDQSQNKQIKRRHRMKDEFGNIVKKPKTRKVTSPKQPNRDAAERLIRLVLNIRCLKIGTLTKIFRRSDTLTAQSRFTLDYIEITNVVSSLTLRIETSEVTSCEWCTVQRLPALFLQITPVARHRLRAQIVYYVCEDHSLAWGDCASKNQDEKYLVLIFEEELSLPDQLILEEIFTEIGRRNNICSCPVKLSFEEACSRLKTHNCNQRQQIPVLQPKEDELPVMSQTLVPISPSPDPTRCETATLSVSDSDEDLIVVPSSPVHEIKKLLVYPPPPAKGGISITEEDLSCLEEGTFLNDVIVDFYLRFLVCEQLKREDAIDCHVFSSFFFKHLTKEDHKRPPEPTGLSVQELRHNRVKTWTRHVNIFEKDFIFVPINQKAHWFLAVICFPGRISQTSDSDACFNGHSAEYLCDQSLPNPMSLFYRQESSENGSSRSQSIGDLNNSFWFDSDDEIKASQDFENTCALNSERNDSKRPCILIMDSLHSRARSSVVQILQEYLQEEWRVKMGYSQSFGNGVMDGWSPRVPQQDNYTDCGIYLLQYTESFLKNPPQSFHPSMDLNDWFSRKTVKEKRKQIKRLILKLHQEQQFDI
ncbi:sentrin-specific protease 6 isoform X1 [Misgurnus anguillicaudatus]|uniref:sentrin-specific protease 6 isoform X1 n=1 Tax=Misgurnus anguillicaudatus TaxID=75329 RepID=UPI003CCFD8CA